MLEARADVVGSLLRPPELRKAQEAYARGELTPAEFKARRGPGGRPCDRTPGGGRPRRRHGRRDATALLPERSPRCGRGLRRLGSRRVPLGPLGERGARPDGGRAAADRRRREAPPRALDRRRGVRLRAGSRATRPLKVTLPSPSLFANFWDPERSTDAYPSLEAFLEDVAEILREEVDELERLGCTYVQLDAPHYPLLLDEGYRAFYESRGWPADRWLELGLELDNHVIGEAVRASRSASISAAATRHHAGSSRAATTASPSGSSADVRADRLLLEYDDDRSGDFEPLAHVPDDKVAVLGLVTTKTARRETVEELERPHPGGCAASVRSSAWRCRRSADSPPRSSETRSPRRTSGRSSGRSRRRPGRSGRDGRPRRALAHRRRGGAGRPRRRSTSSSPRTRSSGWRLRVRSSSGRSSGATSCTGSRRVSVSESACGSTRRPARGVQPAADPEPPDRERPGRVPGDRARDDAPARERLRARRLGRPARARRADRRPR